MIAPDGYHVWSIRGIHLRKTVGRLALSNGPGGKDTLGSWSFEVFWGRKGAKYGRWFHVSNCWPIGGNPCVTGFVFAGYGLNLVIWR